LKKKTETAEMNEERLITEEEKEDTMKALTPTING
jgi:hypothetical protein